MKPRTLLRKSLDASAQERERIRRENAAALPTNQRKAAEVAEREESAGEQCIETLYGQKAPPSAWKAPFFSAVLISLGLGTVTTGVTVYFNRLTWDLPGWALGLVGIGLPAAIVASKVGATTGALGNVDELKPALDTARRESKRYGLALVATGAAFALSKSVGQIPDAVSLGILTLLEGALAFVLSSYVSQAIIHGQPPLRFRAARNALTTSHTLASVMEALGDSAPIGRTGSPSANGAAPLHPQPRGEARISANLRAIILASALSLAVASEGRAAAIGIGVFVDRTPSVSAAELQDDLPVVGKGLAGTLVKSSFAVRLEWFAWDGSPQSSRVPTKRWELDSLVVPECSSPFPTRCALLRQQAILRLARARAPILAQVRDALGGTATRARATGKSCIWSLLADAAALGRSVVLTDAALENCPQTAASVRGSDHVLVVVLARTGDGPHTQERIAARVALLVGCGFRAIDGRALHQVDWDAFVSGSLR